MRRDSNPQPPASPVLYPLKLHICVAEATSKGVSQCTEGSPQTQWPRPHVGGDGSRLISRGDRPPLLQSLLIYYVFNGEDEARNLHADVTWDKPNALSPCFASSERSGGFI